MESMIIPLLLWMVIIAFPEETIGALDEAELRIRLFYLNCVLFVRSYIIYVKLKRGFAKSNLPIPPFRFTPIQDRK